MVDPAELVTEIDWRPTTRSREMSGARANETLLGTKRDRSYPPNVRLPKTLLSPMKGQNPCCT